MPLPTIRQARFRGATVWEVDARAMGEACRARKIPIRRKFPSKRAAEDWAAELMRKLEREPANRIEVCELCAHFLTSREAHVRPDTINSYRSPINRLTAWCTASGITYTDQLDRAAIGDFTDHLARAVAKRTAAQYLTVISLCFGWAVTRGFIESNLFAGLGRRSRKTTRRTLTDDERRRITTEAEHAALWTFMLGTGCRVVEIVRMRAEHVHLDSPLPHVLAMGKGGKERSIPIGPEIAEIARRLLAAGNGVLWTDGRRWGLHEAWRKDRAALELPKEITPHVFRHDYASWLVNVEGLPLPDAMRVLGHADLATTAIYLHPDGRKLGAAVTGRSRALGFQLSGNSARKVR